MLHRISQLFSVRPVQEPLFQHTPCPDTASNTNVGAFLEPHTDRGSTSTPHSCSPPPYNPRTCAITPGIPPLTLPPETGFPDTDLVVYVTATQSGPCVPYLSNAPSSDTNTEKEAQPASDSKVNTGRRLSTTSRKGTYAFATTCMREDAGRPILGRINFCPGKECWMRARMIYFFVFVFMLRASLVVLNVPSYHHSYHSHFFQRVLLAILHNTKLCTASQFTSYSTY